MELFPLVVLVAAALCGLVAGFAANLGRIFQVEAA
jgi:hypothetical protein